MKKWTLAVMIILTLGTGLMACKENTEGADDYLESAKQYAEEGSYDQVILNMEKALQESRKQNGDSAVETGEIYRKLANIVKDLNQALEYFDKAILIYEIADRPIDAAQVCYEKGMVLTNANAMYWDDAKDTFKSVVERCLEHGYDNADIFCMSYYYLAEYAENLEERIDYLKKADALLKETSEENQKTLTGIIKLSIGEGYFIQEKYQESMEYYETALEEIKASESGSDQGMTGTAYRQAGACLLYLGNVEQAKEKLEQAVSVYQKLEINDYYLPLAQAYVYLSKAYAAQEIPDTEKALEYGLKAMDCYKGRSIVTSDAYYQMEALKEHMKEIYQMVYPEKEDWEFDEWYEKNGGAL